MSNDVQNAGAFKLYCDLLSLSDTGLKHRDLLEKFEIISHESREKVRNARRDFILKINNFVSAGADEARKFALEQTIKK